MKKTVTVLSTILIAGFAATLALFVQELAHPRVARADGGGSVSGITQSGDFVNNVRPVMVGIADTNSQGHTLSGDSSGRAIVVGAETAGAAVVGLGLRTMGSDGANARDFLVDGSGRQVCVGPTADGGAAGNPTQVAGKNNAGNLVTFPVTATGVTAPAACAITGGTDGTNAQAIRLDTTGRQIVVGGAADAAAQVGNSVPFAGKDGSGNIRTVTVVPAGTSAGATPPLLIAAGQDSANITQAIPVQTPGQSSSGRMVPIGTLGIDAAIHNLRSDATGKLLTGDSDKATYSVSGLYAPPSGATDTILITGSVTKVFKLRRLVLTGTATAVTVPVTIVRRSATDTTGTFVADTPLPHDSGDAATTITVGHYTANPGALGTAVGTLYSGYWTLAATGTIGQPLVIDFSIRGDKAVYLNSATQFLAVNLGATAFTSPLLAYTLEYTEE